MSIPDRLTRSCAELFSVVFATWVAARALDALYQRPVPISWELNLINANE